MTAPQRIRADLKSAGTPREANGPTRRTMMEQENEAMITLKRSGKGSMHVFIGGRYVGNVEKIRHGAAWKAIPLREVAHARPAGIGKARTAREAAKFFI